MEQNRIKHLFPYDLQIKKYVVSKLDYLLSLDIYHNIIDVDSYLFLPFPYHADDIIDSFDFDDSFHIKFRIQDGVLYV